MLSSNMASECTADLDIQGSHAHYALEPRMEKFIILETIEMHNNVKRCLI